MEQVVDTSYLRALDLHEREDNIKSFKSEYFLPIGHLYFSAHQLGPISKRVKAVTLERLEQWQGHTNAGWKLFNWLDVEDTMAEKIANLVKVSPQDVGFAPTLTTGLHILLSTFYKPSS